jgi:hypothetical protein
MDGHVQLLQLALAQAVIECDAQGLGGLVAYLAI